MANAQRGEVAITIAGQSYTLVLDMDALCQAETHMTELTGRLVTVAQLMVAAASASLVHTRALLWASMRQHHPDVSVVAAGELLATLGGPAAFFATLRALKKASEPEGTDRPPRARQGRPNRTGARTTSTRDA